MALSRVTSGNAASGLLSFNSGYAVNDLILLVLENSANANTPGTPTGYTSLTSAQDSTNGFAMRMVYKFATSTSETAPTPTNCTSISYAIYTGVNQTTPFSNTAGQANGGSATISYSGIVTFAGVGTDWIVTCGVSKSLTGNIGSHPPNSNALVTEYKTGFDDNALFDSNGTYGSSSYSFNSKTLDASEAWITKTTELQAASGGTVHMLSVTGALGVTGGFAKTADLPLSGATALQGAFSRAMTRTLNASLNLQGSLLQVVARALNGSLGVVGSMFKQTEKSFAGASGLSGSIPSRSIGRHLSGSTELMGTLGRQSTYNLSGSTNLSGSIKRKIFKIMTGSLYLIGLNFVGLMFDGSQNYAQETTPNLYTNFQDHDWSMAFWINPFSTDTNRMIANIGTAGNDACLHIFRDGSGKIHVNYYGDDAAGGIVAPQDALSCVVITSSNSTKLRQSYINGVVDINGAASGNLNVANNSPFLVSVVPSGFSAIFMRWLGLANNFQIWNRVLTSGEIAGLQNSVTPTSGLIAQWLMNEESGATLNDNSGTGNTATLHGSPLPMWISEGFVKRLNRTLNGTFGFTGTLVRGMFKNLSGALGLQGVWGTNSAQQVSLSGSTNLQGNVLRQTNRSLSGTTNLSGSIARRISRSFSGSLSLTGNIARRVARLLSGQTALSGSIARTAKRLFSSSLAQSGSISKTTARNLLGSLQVAGNVTKRTSRTVAGTTSMSGSVTKRQLKSLTGSLALTGSLQRQVDRSLAGHTSLSGAIQKQTDKAFLGQTGLSGSVGRQTNRQFGGALALTGYITRLIPALFTGSLGVIGDLSTRYIPAAAKNVLRKMLHLQTADKRIKLEQEAKSIRLQSDPKTTYLHDE